MLQEPVDSPMDMSPERGGGRVPYSHVVLGENAVKLSGEPHQEVVPPIFQLGDGPDRLEYIENDQRILAWGLAGNENILAEPAGWLSLPHELTKTTGYLLLPEGTRSARSVLSGLEAYDSEKALIVQKASSYLRWIRRELDQVDTSFSWGSTGITPDDAVIFIAPPHALSKKTDPEVAVWAENMTKELQLLLWDDKRNRALVEAFKEAVR